jgi:hypothetical protein
MNSFDSYEDGWEKPINKKKTFKDNPNGPYRLKITVRGVNWDVTIKSTSALDHKVKAICEKKATKNDLEVLKNYLEKEGFNDAAKKHNLFW